MIRSLYIAQSGLDAQQFNVDVISNNLANVSTNGFKRQRPVFEDLLYQTLRQPGAQSSQLTQYPTGLQLGTGVALVATARIFTQGNLQQVGGSLNLAIEGRGFFQILLPNGNTAYTRDGGFQLDSQGQIVNALGFTLQPTITIPADALTITIGGDGTVTVTQPGNATPTQIGNIQLADFINAGGLQAIGNNLYLETASSGPPTTGDPGVNGLGVLNQGFLEASNVSVTEELVDLITAQRAFEINSRAVQVSDEMLQRLANLGA
jgi:flagellar basal-body rod protein FlgG